MEIAKISKATLLFLILSNSTACSPLSATSGAPARTSEQDIASIVLYIESLFISAGTGSATCGNTNACFGANSSSSGSTMTSDSATCTASCATNNDFKQVVTIKSNAALFPCITLATQFSFQFTNATFTFTFPKTTASGVVTVPFAMSFTADVSGGTFKSPSHIECSFTNNLIGTPSSSTSSLFVLYTTTGSISDCTGFSCTLDGQDLTCPNFQTALAKPCS